MSVPELNKNLPVGWCQCAIADLVEPSKARFNPTNGTRQAYIGLEHIDKGTGTLNGSGLSDEVRSTKGVFEKGDLLYGRLRPYLNKVVVPDFAGVCSTDILVFPCPQGVSSKFLCYRFLDQDFVSYATQNMSGVQHPRVSAKAIGNYSIFIPSENEQLRIVEKIEYLLTKLDAGVEALRKAQALLKRYRTSVLKAACEGRLVPTEAELARREGRDYEPADKLLARVLKERREAWEAAELVKLARKGTKIKGDAWEKKYQEPADPKTDGLPELPEGWVWATVGQLTGFITSGSRGWGDYYAENGAIFIRAQDIKTDKLNLNGVAHVSLENVTEGLRTRVAKDDLLVTITGANVTKSAIVNCEISEAYVSQHVALIRPVINHISPYLIAWIIAPHKGRKELERLAYGAGKPGLNLDNIRDLVVALPPQSEQLRIVAEVDRQISLADNLENSCRESLEASTSLRQSILSSAFQGKLVPQDPNDEPASLLLERIKAARVQATPTRKTTRARRATRRS